MHKGLQYFGFVERTSRGIFTNIKKENSKTTTHYVSAYFLVDLTLASVPCGETPQSPQVEMTASYSDSNSLSSLIIASADHTDGA
jgi:hypothetical protein